MKNILCATLILAFILNISTKSSAQNDTVAFKKFQVGFVPHYSLYEGVRVDFEYIFKDGFQHIQISPQIYSDKRESHRYYTNTKYEKLSGFGIGLDHKIFVHYSEQKIVGIYFGYGADYARFVADYKTFAWGTYTDEGLEYYSYALRDAEQTINRVKLSLYFGIQINIANSLYVSAYAGYGASYAFSTMDIEVADIKFDKRMWDYAYTGTYFPLGFKFGMKF